mmetsp:Transcript_13250/g.31358  ORF Transcript_13250/g.31358 Transcript_13250/m.31358 type:complete len:368 (+) Transcript_13250:8-1111(+)
MAERSVSDSDSFELFVPGRVALLGEHSDWAAGFREHSGYCLVTGTEQGLYARVRRLSDRKALVLRSVDESGVAASTWLDLEDPTALLALAQAGGFWSYAAGVAYQIVVTNEVGGLEVDNYRTTLPLRKGLSSSAALCVLVARAFSKAYKLKYTIRGEMELAYRGEIATPSKCGRMDQCCAFGSTPVFMTFDGDHLFCEPLGLPRGAVFHYVIVDLLAKKDTTEILAALRQAYTFSPTSSEDPARRLIEEGVVRFLGPTNKRLLLAAREAFLAGDAEKIGAIMKEYQSLFDSQVGPACPNQLTAPVLHKCIEWPSLQPLIWGAKGIGSQGDGAAQFLCRSREAQTEVMRIVREELLMIPMELIVTGPK